MATYVIGDIHGQFDALQYLLHDIKYDKNDDILIFVGDYTDWGPKSIDTVKYIMNLEKQGHVIALLGNHDLMARNIICKPAYAINKRDWSDWVNNGGLETFNQFKSLPKNEQEQIIEWYNNRPIHYETTVSGKQYYISHAWILRTFDGDIALDKDARDEDIKDCVWYRPMNIEKDTPFIGLEKYKNCTLICGHTITYDFKPKILPHFIDIDTGAKIMGHYKNACLTAYCLDNNLYFSTDKT